MTYNTLFDTTGSRRADQAEQASSDLTRSTDVQDGGLAAVGALGALQTPATPALHETKNSSIRAAVMQGAQQTVGNRAVQRLVKAGQGAAAQANARRSAPVPVQREKGGGEAGEEDESWAKSVGQGLLGVGLGVGGEQFTHFLEHGSDAIEGMGEEVGGVGGLMFGPIGIARGLHEGGLKGGLETTAGILETIGGFGGIAGTAAGESGAGIAAASGLLGEGGAVLGAGLAGWEIGRGLDNGANAIGRYVTGDDKGDYSLSGMASDLAVKLDKDLTPPGMPTTADGLWQTWDDMKQVNQSVTEFGLEHADTILDYL